MQSEQINELVTALSKAQMEFKPVKKDQEAKGKSFSYHYADLATVLEAVREPLSKNGLCLMHTTEWTEGGAFVLIGRLVHISGQFISAHWPLPTNAGPQDLGSHLTYGRRYTATALLGIAAEEDDDAQKVKDDKVSTAKPRTVQGKQPLPPVAPGPNGEAKPQITLMRAKDGSQMNFPVTKRGAAAALESLDVLIEEDPDNWAANREMALHLSSTAGNVEIEMADGKTTVGNHVTALLQRMEGPVP